jgi:cell division protein ZapA
MAEVTLDIGGRRYDVTCRDGEEAHLRHIATLVNDKATKARDAVGGVNETRQLLLAALLLADELNDAREGAAPVPSAPASPPDAAIAAAIEKLAARVESFADRLEDDGASA